MLNLRNCSCCAVYLNAHATRLCMSHVDFKKLHVAMLNLRVKGYISKTVWHILDYDNGMVLTIPEP